MPSKRLKRPTDIVQRGKLIGDILTGQVEDRGLTPEEEGKNIHAVKAGRLGGAKGGKSRAESLTEAQRSESAKLAARARWRKL